MAWFVVDFLSESRESVVGMQVCFSLKGVASELREKCAFGDGSRGFERAAVRD